MTRKKDMNKLLADIAKVTNTDLETIKEAHEASTLYSHEESVYEAQSVIGYYLSRVAPKPPEKKPGESQVDFNKRKREYEANYNAWRIKVCKGCNQEFAYAFGYDGVSYCSLDCLDSELRKIGLRVTRGRDLKKRWGVAHPAIVPSSALAALHDLYGRETGEACD